ncbi:MAG: hypothetical protein V4526_02825 [Patescibacteria group bacterium]
MKLIAIIVAVIVVGGGIWLVSSKDNTPVDNNVPVGIQSNGSQDKVGQPDQKTPTSLEEAMVSGGQYTCTFNTDDPNAHTRGTFYIDGEKVRGDFEAYAVETGKSFITHMVSDGSFSWTWTEPATIGMKMPVIKNASASVSTDGRAPVQGMMTGSMSFQDGAVKTNYDCVVWNGDDSKFSIPAGLKFMEAPVDPRR